MIMTYASVITSKGTITIPAGLRKSLGLVEGARVAIEQGVDGQVIVKRMPDLDELRARNRAHLQRVGLTAELDAGQVNGQANDQGFVAYIHEKYGSKA